MRKLSQGERLFIIATAADAVFGGMDMFFTTPPS
jgi:hypothetical protein